MSEKFNFILSSGAGCADTYPFRERRKGMPQCKPTLFDKAISHRNETLKTILDLANDGMRAESPEDMYEILKSIEGECMEFVAKNESY